MTPTVIRTRRAVDWRVVSTMAACVAFWTAVILALHFSGAL